MKTPDSERRSFLFGMGGFAFLPALPQDTPSATSSNAGYVLGVAEGEHLIHFRDGGNIFIKASSNTGSSRVAVGTQQVKVDAGIPVHRHLEMDETFYILEGNGTFLLNDVPHPFQQGATIYIPKHSWHGFLNPDHELLLLWIVVPGGLDGFFRETCNPPGVPPKKFTHEQISLIARKYETEFR